MIAVDTSAIVAIALGEPERAEFRQKIMGAAKALISTVSAVEARIEEVFGNDRHVIYSMPGKGLGCHP